MQLKRLKQTWLPGILSAGKLDHMMFKLKYYTAVFVILTCIK